MMTSAYSWFIPFVIIIIISCLSNYLTIAADSSTTTGEYIPITYKINQKQTECIYDKFDKSDFVTFSVFVIEALYNGHPKASIAFEGPIWGNGDVLEKIGESPIDVNTNKDALSVSSLGRDLRTGVQTHWPKVKNLDQQVRYDKRVGVISRSLTVDWTHAGESEDAMAARAQIGAEKKEAYRNYGGRGAPVKNQDEENEKRNEKFRTITQVKIEPFQQTNSIKAEGWYRLCVSSDYYALMIEMEMRSGNKLGGVDRTTGHVYTHEAREMLNEEQMIEDNMLDESSSDDSELDSNTYATMKEELEKVLENQVKEQDLHATKAQIKHLNTMVLEMKKKHHDFHTRLKVHSSTSRRNYDNLTWSSKLETVLYVIITGVQVYTVRRWLLGNTLLGT